MSETPFWVGEDSTGRRRADRRRKVSDMPWKPRPDDPVIYRVTKQSETPGPRAEAIAPSSAGETYTYNVDKYWRVEKLLEDGKIQVYTRRGKRHVLNSSDPNMIKPGWLQRLFLRDRFPAPLENAPPILDDETDDGE